MSLRDVLGREPVTTVRLVDAPEPPSPRCWDMPPIELAEVVAGELDEAGVGHKFKLDVTGGSIFLQGPATFEVAWDGAVGLWHVSGALNGDYITAEAVVAALRPAIVRALGPRTRFVAG